MIVREEPDGAVLAIAQPDHAALAGRLAAAWDDGVAPGLLPAATHHDDVWAARDAAPPRSAETGRPQTFLELSDGERLAVWSRAQEVAAPLGPEAELWVLRHAERLHASYDAAAIKAMVAAFGVRVDELLAALRAASPAFDDAALLRGTSLLALWDTLSLRLCFGVDEPVDAGVLRLSPAGDAVAVAPWPFRGGRLEVSVRARRLTEAAADQSALDAAWAAAAPFDLPFTLLPA